MSMGYTRCPYCNSGEAEKLYAVDHKVECYCHNCYAEWTTEPEVLQDTPYETFMLQNYGEVV